MLTTSRQKHFSEQEQRKLKAWSKRSKTAHIHIYREEVVTLYLDRLSLDTQFKWYEEIVVQDVLLHTDNILLHKEKFYSPSQHTTYLASLSQSYRWQFNSVIKS